jgi:hypothetical protein
LLVRKPGREAMSILTGRAGRENDRCKCEKDNITKNQKRGRNIGGRKITEK